MGEGERRSEKNAVLFGWRFQADPYVMLACRPGGRKALCWRFERTWLGVRFGGEDDEKGPNLERFVI